MASDSSMSFQQSFHSRTPFYYQNEVCFQPGPMNPSLGMIPTAIKGYGAINRTMSNKGSSTNPSGISLDDSPFDPTSCFKYDKGMAADWSMEDHILLKQGLVKYANEPNIMQYIKIAATMRDKSVRDVALRCLWMKKKEILKRRNSEENYASKRIKVRKEKMVYRSSVNVNSVLAGSFPVPSQAVPNLRQNNQIYDVAPTMDCMMQQLLEENAQILSQIDSNLEILKMNDNIDLFCHARDNIIAIEKRMSEMPGMMRQMPPLPMLLNHVDPPRPIPAQAILLGTPPFCLDSHQNPNNLFSKPDGEFLL